MRSKLWFGVAAAAILWAGGANAQEADQPGDASTQARVAAGQTVQGEISPAGDVDWYRLNAEAGMRYRITLDGVADAEGAAIDPVLSVWDANGSQLAFNDDSGDTLNSALNWGAQQGGEVFVEARGFSPEATGRYALNISASPAPPDDAGNDSSSQASVQPGTPINGSLEIEGDSDWYRLNARRGMRYRITLNGAAGENSLPDPLLRVMDANGAELAMNDDGPEGLNSQLDFTPQANGLVYVVAAGFADVQAGDYTLSVTASRAPTDSISADTRTRGRIRIGESLNGSIDFEDDADWHRIRLEQGQSYRFTLVGAGENPLQDPLVRLRGGNGEELAMDDDGGEGLNSYLEFTAPQTGSYYVEAAAFGGSMGGYTLSALEGDVPASAATDVTLSADGDFRQGELSPAGDRDWYRLDLAEGQGVRIGLTSAEGANALSDPYLSVRAADGSEIATDDDGGDGLNSWLEFQAPSAGAYFIEARGFTEDAQGQYLLSVNPGEIGASANDAEMLLAGPEGRTAQIGAPGDADWFAIELIEGRPYRFTLEGAGPDALADPILTLYDSNGVQVASDDDGGPGLNSYLPYVSVSGGIYFAAVSAYGEGAIGRYNLRVSDTDVPGNPNTDEYLDNAGDDRISRIDMAGDLDYYRVDLEAGVTYVIDVRGTGDAPLADPFLTVLNESNERVTSDDDSGDGLDARLRFTPSTAGTYYIQASGLGGSTGWYQVAITRR